MFTPSRTEVAEAEDLLASLLTQGRKIYHSPKGQAERIREQIEEANLRSATLQAAALARLQWRPRAAVALLDTRTCQHCHTSQTVFLGFGLSMYRNTDAAERIVMTPQLDTAFPRETHYTQTITSGCPTCLPQRGFNLGVNPNGQT